MDRFIAEYPIPGNSTFFVHEYFQALESTLNEICPHPFIDDLSKWKDNLIKFTKQFGRHPKGIRTHSCVYSHKIGIELNSLGYKYISQVSNLFQTGLKPYRHPWGIWEIPIYYMDNMDFWMSQNWTDISHTPFNRDVIKVAIDSDELFVFDFHPLHIALNTNNSKSYSDVREKIINNHVSPFDIRNKGRGVDDFFKELCSLIEQSGQRSFSCIEALEHFMNI